MGQTLVWMVLATAFAAERATDAMPQSPFQERGYYITFMRMPTSTWMTGKESWTASTTMEATCFCCGWAGSVVTRDIPKGVFAAGNPCRVIREITE